MTIWVLSDLRACLICHIVMVDRQFTLNPHCQAGDPCVQYVNGQLLREFLPSGSLRCAVTFLEYCICSPRSVIRMGKNAFI